MKSFECPNCGNLMDDNEKRCKYCGSANPNYSGPRYNPQPVAAVNAQQNAQSSTPVKKEKEKMNVLVFILLLIFFWPAAIIYAIVCMAK